MAQLRKASRKKAAENPALWTDIPGSTIYAANERGFVLNKESKSIIANTTYSNGYVYVSIREGSRFKNKRLNRVIALTFHPNPGNLPHVNHENGIKVDNHSANLKWSSVSDNLKHAFRTGLRQGSKPQLGKINDQSARSRPVFQFSLDGVFIKEWPSLSEAGRWGFTPVNIGKVCMGQRKTHKGFIWKYSIK